MHDMNYKKHGLQKPIYLNHLKLLMIPDILTPATIRNGFLREREKESV